MTEPPEPWDVYYVFTDQIHPPKPKYIVVAAVLTKALCFFINSRISEFAKKRNYLLPCFVPLTAKEQPFLDYDSFMNCQEAFTFEINQLTDKKGRLCEPSIEQAKKAVSTCVVLKLEHKKLILGIPQSL